MEGVIVYLRSLVMAVLIGKVIRLLVTGVTVLSLAGNLVVVHKEEGI